MENVVVASIVYNVPHSGLLLCKQSQPVARRLHGGLHIIWASTLNLL